MADEPTPPPNPAAQPPPAGEPSGVLDLARRLLVGTVAMTLDELNDLLQRLRGRGELPEAEVKRLVEEYVEARPKGDGLDATAAAESTSLAPADKSQGALERSVETILVRLNVPTRSDIESLSRKITLLNEKVTRLKELRDAERAMGQAIGREGGRDAGHKVTMPPSPAPHAGTRSRPSNGQAE